MRYGRLRWGMEWKAIPVFQQFSTQDFKIITTVRQNKKLGLGLHHDFEVCLKKLAPGKPYSQYQHNGFEDNADTHIKRILMGREV
jgi:thiamine phosphate synthase YjbQ (UPF0047 family)